jgi:uncharacterized short protein YbdD (DUF466 family)
LIQAESTPVYHLIIAKPLSLGHNNKPCTYGLKQPNDFSFTLRTAYKVILKALLMKWNLHFGSSSAKSWTHLHHTTLSQLCRDGTAYNIMLHYITLLSLDAELVKMTVGCGICHINIKTYVHYVWSFRKRKPKKTVVTHEAIQKYIHIYIYISTVNSCCLHNL